LQANYLAIGGGIGTYTRPNGKNTWTKHSSYPNSETDFSVGITIDGKGAIITEYKGKITTVRIPATIKGLPVREIGERAFWNSSYESTTDNVNSRIISVIIPEGVTTIGTQAFYRCKNLYIISLPNSLTSIGNSAFAGCEALDSITLPSSLKKIGKEAFSSSGLFSINLPTGLTTISEAAFAYTDLWRVTISEGVREIGEGVFYECTSLRSVTLPSTIMKIGYQAFYNCSSLTTMDIPETIKKIEFVGRYLFLDYYDKESYAFYGCHKLDLDSQATLRRVGYKDSF
jgi:hypothetical protein